MKWKKTLYFLMGIVILFFIMLFSINYWICIKASPYIYTNIKDVPVENVGVILGTSKYYRTGNLNAFYINRIKGAVALYNEKKIHTLLVSGDNATHSYNEPITMYNDLRKAGIPEHAIVLDYAGFRTLDSIIRTRKVFNTSQFAIITQRFHCERAIFIALHHNLSAKCYAVPPNKINTLLYLREIFARLLAVNDLYVLKKQPRFLGPLIELPSANNPPIAE